MTTLRPADFGSLGNPADDTATMLLVAAAANDGDVIELSGHLRIDGAIPFDSHQRLTVAGRALVEQVSNFKQTFEFTNFGNIDVEGIDFRGRGGAAGEYNGASSAYNNVSALFFDTGEQASVMGITATDHAGGDISFRNVKHTRAHHNTLTGIGSGFINPIDNGGDIAICAQTWSARSPFSMEYTHDWSHNRISGHAFGAMAVGTKSMIFHGNEVSACGQHGFYGIELDGMNFSGNNFYGCPQNAIKMQHENYAGQFFGTPWTVSTFMPTGCEKTYSGTLYLCISGHTSSASFINDWKVDIRWIVSPRMKRRGGAIIGNQAYDCGSVVGIISSSLSDGKEEYIDGLTISDNAGFNCLADGYTLDRCVNVDFLNNRVEKAQRFGLYTRDSSGRFNDNRIYASTHCGMYMTLSYDSEIKRNLLLDTGLTGAGVSSGFPIYVSGMDTPKTIPSQATNPTVVFDGNHIKYTNGDCVSAQATFFDVRYKVDMTENRTNSVKPGRINGTKLRVRNNDFVSIM